MSTVSIGGGGASDIKDVWTETNSGNEVLVGDSPFTITETGSTITYVNSSGGAVTITPPASPAAGDRMKIVDVGGQASGNNIIITGVDTINTNFGSVEYRFDGVAWDRIEATITYFDVVGESISATDLETNYPAANYTNRYGLVDSGDATGEDGLYRSNGFSWVKKLNDSDFDIGNVSLLWDAGSAANESSSDKFQDATNRTIDFNGLNSGAWSSMIDGDDATGPRFAVNGYSGAYWDGQSLYASRFRLVMRGDGNVTALMALQGRRRSDEVWQNLTISSAIFENDPLDLGIQFNSARDSFIVGVQGGNLDHLALVLESKDQTEYDGFRWINLSIGSVYVNSFEAYTADIFIDGPNELATNKGTITTLGTVDSGSTANWFDTNEASGGRMTSEVAGVEKTNMPEFALKEFIFVMRGVGATDGDFEIAGYNGSTWTALNTVSVEAIDTTNATATANGATFNVDITVGSTNEKFRIITDNTTKYIGWRLQRTAVNSGSVLLTIREFQGYESLSAYSEDTLTNAINRIARGNIETSKTKDEAAIDAGLNEYFIPVDATAAAATVTLPNAADIQGGKSYKIKKVDSSVNAVDISGDVNIDGAGTQSLTTQYDFIEVVLSSDKSEWWIVAN